MKVLYHANCDDGFGAAWIASKHLSSEGTPHECIPVNYGDAPPEIQAGEKVFILDFSYPRQVLLDMAEIANITVLDHHKTAQADLQDLPFAHFDMERSGAMMASEWFHPRGTRIPQIVQYIQDRDLWRKELPDSEAVTEYIRSWPRDFLVWDHIAEMLEVKFDQAVAEGKAILRRVGQQIEAALQRARWSEVGGYRVWVANETQHFSEVAGKLAERDGALFGAVYFIRADGKVQWSLRSHGDFDVSVVAKNYGGGGHKNAAGFTVEPATPDTLQAPE